MTIGHSLLEAAMLEGGSEFGIPSVDELAAATFLEVAIVQIGIEVALINLAIVDQFPDESIDQNRFEYFG
jgi:hypothetical protein